MLRSSARHSYDPEVDIDWDAPIDPSLWGMQPERMSLYGTHLWDGLTEEQRITLSHHEVASIASVGLWFELLLMQMMLRDLYDDDPTGAHMHYALTEVADECRHSTMFGKSIGHFGVPAYGPPHKIHRLGRLFNHVVRGPERLCLDPRRRGDPRHLAARPDEGRAGAADHPHGRAHPRARGGAPHDLRARGGQAAARGPLGATAPAAAGDDRPDLPDGRALSLVNPKVYLSVGIDPREGRRTALGNPHYRATMQWMGEKPLAFLRENDLLPKSQEKVWRASLLLGLASGPSPTCAAPPRAPYSRGSIRRSPRRGRSGRPRCPGPRRAG